MSDSLWPQEVQHGRLPCPPPNPGACTNSCPLSQWCHPTLSSFVIPFSSRLQSFPGSGSFQGVSSSHPVAKVLEFQLQHQSFQRILRTDFLWDGLVGCPCKGTLKSLLQHHSSKASILQHSVFFILQLSHPYMTTGKTMFGKVTFVGKVMSMLFNTLSRFVMQASFNFMAAVTICSDFGAQENKV